MVYTKQSKRRKALRRALYIRSIAQLQPFLTYEQTAFLRRLVLMQAVMCFVVRDSSPHSPQSSIYNGQTSHPFSRLQLTIMMSIVQRMMP